MEICKLICISPRRHRRQRRRQAAGRISPSPPSPRRHLRACVGAARLPAAAAPLSAPTSIDVAPLLHAPPRPEPAPAPLLRPPASSSVSSAVLRLQRPTRLPPSRRSRPVSLSSSLFVHLFVFIFRCLICRCIQCMYICKYVCCKCLVCRCIQCMYVDERWNLDAYVYEFLDV